MTNDEFKTELEEIRSNIEKAESETELETLNAQMDDLEARKQQALEEAKAEAELRTAVAEGEVETRSIKTFEEEVTTVKTIDEIRASQEYVDAYADFIRTGSDRECRSLLTELAEGTVPVPAIVSDFINNAWEKLVISARANEMFVPGIVRVPYEVSATDAGVHTEGGEALSAEDLVLGTVDLTPATIKKWIKVSDEALAMSSADLLRYVIDEITYKIFQFLDGAAVAAIGASSLTAQVEKAFGFDSIFAGLAELADGAANPVVILNKSVFFNGFLALKDDANRPIYNVVMENGKPRYYLNGVEVLFSSSMGDDTSTPGEVYALVGDMSGLTINYVDGRDVKIITDPYSLAELDLVKIVGSIKVGIGVTKPGYFAAIAVPAES